MRLPRSDCVVEYDGSFTFPVSLPRLWASVAQLEDFGSWWGWLQDFSVEGEGLTAGTVLHGIVAPPLPYRMRLAVHIEDCVPEQRIVAAVRGDLEGAATLHFDGDDDQARVRAAWKVEMMQRPMRLAARFGHPLLLWGHDCVVDATVDRFRRQLVGGR